MHQTTPGLLDLAEAAGLAVLRAPLMVCEPERLSDLAPKKNATIRLLDAADPAVQDDLVQLRAALGVAFGNPGTETGAAGTPPSATKQCPMVVVRARPTSS
ncbi:hypothetical protein [Fodinicola feengrottensis]|uniref:hypothetical protein n=1 Tax=Fodinicola feengrottensis TaxID=435914 RepID=UPI0024412360|nr:hypothetical protein [Fodinicola feengrottensis]